MLAPLASGQLFWAPVFALLEFEGCDKTYHPHFSHLFVRYAQLRTIVHFSYYFTSKNEWRQHRSNSGYAVVFAASLMDNLCWILIQPAHTGFDARRFHHHCFRNRRARQELDETLDDAAHDFVDVSQLQQLGINAADIQKLKQALVIPIPCIAI